ncbi:hypothetical protein J4Q44_G00211360 [Coregonus suidteri]|uniref:Uncharacterized protein n=1 Tax=Coregonus suidteri TaxID=861788 RepID=A0AAN8QLN2_9TELE
MELQEITFSGWTAIQEKKLHEGENPKQEKVYTMYHGTYLKFAQSIITGAFQVECWDRGSSQILEAARP